MVMQVKREGKEGQCRTEGRRGGVEQREERIVQGQDGKEKEGRMKMKIYFRSDSVVFRSYSICLNQILIGSKIYFRSDSTF